jgi:hypothetical protein
MHASPAPDPHSLRDDMPSRYPPPPPHAVSIAEALAVPVPHAAPGRAIVEGRTLRTRVQAVTRRAPTPGAHGGRRRGVSPSVLDCIENAIRKGLVTQVPIVFRTGLSEAAVYKGLRALEADGRIERDTESKVRHAWRIRGTP